MENAHLLVVRLGDNEVLDREHLSGEGAIGAVYRRWLDEEVNKYSELGVLAYAQCGRDFEDRMVAEVFLKEDAKLNSKDNNSDFNEINIGSERPPFQETVDLIAGSGNHEAKLLSLIYLYKEGVYLNSYRMGTGFRNFLGPAPEWEPSIGMPYGYCAQSFEVLGQVVKGKVESLRGYSIAYSISERGISIGVPLAGMLAEWSLQYPEISLQQVFGHTHSKGETRAPQHRLNLIMELLTSPKSGLSLSEIAGISASDWRNQKYHTALTNIDSAAKGLEAFGIVRTEHVSDFNSREYEITSANYPERSYSRGSIIEEIYSFLRERTRASESRVFVHQECLEYVLQQQKEKGLDMDEADIRLKVVHLLGNAANGNLIPGIKRLETYNEGNLTKVFLNEKYRKPLTELVNIVLAIDEQDPQVLQHGREMAERISGEIELRELLIAKAKKFSSSAQKLPIKQTSEQIYSLLAETDRPLDTMAISELYKARYERTLSPATVRLILRNLIDLNRVQTTKERSQSSIKKRRNFYAARSNEPTD